MDRTPYIPDFAASNLIMLEPFKKQLTGNRMASGTGVKQAVSSWLQTLDTDFLYARTQSRGAIWR